MMSFLFKVNLLQWIYIIIKYLPLQAFQILTLTILVLPALDFLFLRP